MDKSFVKLPDVSGAEIFYRAVRMYGKFLSVSPSLMTYGHDVCDPVGLLAYYIEVCQPATDESYAADNARLHFMTEADICVVPEVMLGQALYAVNIMLCPECLPELCRGRNDSEKRAASSEAAEEAVEWMVAFLSVIRRFDLQVSAQFSDFIDQLAFVPDEIPWAAVSAPWECGNADEYQKDPRYRALALCLIARRLEGKSVNILKEQLFDEGLFPPIPVQDLVGSVKAIDWYLAAFRADEATAYEFASDGAKEMHRLQKPARNSDRFL